MDRNAIIIFTVFRVERMVFNNKQARYRAGVAEHVLEDGHVRELYILCFVVK